jgi:hypothetical protein|tara:strand:+ start:507 stop:1157 length:651 start_codon:yes stop_codon:yes gene_type:complete
MFEKMIKKFKSRKGNSLAEFAVTTAMMATLATTAAPRFAGIGESAKEKKTLANIDRIMSAANNHYMETLEDEGRGRFPGQTKYNIKVGGVDLGDGQQTADALDEWVRNTLPTLLSVDDDLGTYFVYVFAGSADDQVAIEQGIINENSNVGYDEVAPFANVEYKYQFATRMVKSPYQDGGYVYLVIPGSGTGTQSEPPALIVADMENPAKLHKVLVP